MLRGLSQPSYECNLVSIKRGSKYLIHYGWFVKTNMFNVNGLTLEGIFTGRYLGALLSDMKQPL